MTSPSFPSQRASPPTSPSRTRISRTESAESGNEDILPEEGRSRLLSRLHGPLCFSPGGGRAKFIIARDSSDTRIRRHCLRRDESHFEREDEEGYCSDRGGIEISFCALASFTRFTRTPNSS
ncbi:hypothetical protein G7K_6210-t1 [Saitoella complicata NRRL Y-17804]|uniref:Uncharacterized protein n=1 Tax=Saitoella complicata (strain BCRC 22490 / CBS 7301 / JCM 7358 / NBRC 10748 / NRRL Y-17804) TaxID=698492 RepID=A0A0E9NQJ5_SAICN|nr:hypothetical protein G7K_6210-t1 [Saitoella complicata NRRL Y-17804]